MFTSEIHSFFIPEWQAIKEALSNESNRFSKTKSKYWYGFNFLLFFWYNVNVWKSIAKSTIGWAMLHTHNNLTYNFVCTTDLWKILIYLFTIAFCFVDYFVANIPVKRKYGIKASVSRMNLFAKLYKGVPTTNLAWWDIQVISITELIKIVQNLEKLLDFQYQLTMIINWNLVLVS